MSVFCKQSVHHHCGYLKVAVYFVTFCQHKKKFDTAYQAYESLKQQKAIQAKACGNGPPSKELDKVHHAYIHVHAGIDSYRFDLWNFSI